MHLVVDAALLRSAARAALRATDRIRTAVRLAATAGQCVVDGWGGERAIRRTVPATVRAAGEAVLPGRKLYQVASRLAGDVTIRCDAGGVLLQTHRSAVLLRTGSVDLFPATVFAEADAEGSAVTLAGIDFADLGQRAAPITATDATRPILQGVCFRPGPDGTTVWATDGYRVLALERKGLVLSTDAVVVEARSLAEAARVAAGAERVTLRMGPKAAWAEIRTGAVVTSVRLPLLEGTYPAIHDLLPQSYGVRAVVDRQALAGALARVGVMVVPFARSCVLLDVGPDGIRLAACGQDLGAARDVVPATVTGGTLRIAFNPRYLLDGLRCVAGDQVAIGFSSPTNAAVLEPAHGGGTVRYWILPVRVPQIEAA